MTIKSPKNFTIDHQQAPSTKDESVASPQNAGAKAVGGNKSEWAVKVTVDLQQALATWDSLNHDMKDRVSPDEEKLQDIQRILKELKNKLNQF